jgi:benzodiazapine receptor
LVARVIPLGPKMPRWELFFIGLQKFFEDGKRQQMTIYQPSRASSWRRFIPSLIVFLAMVAAAALVGSQFGPGQWYVALQKPSWTPPNWLFGPVWTILYVAIALAGWSVWRSRALSITKPILLWLLQLVLNGLWSWLFFGLRRPDLALIDIVALLIAICWFIASAKKISRIGAWLFVPYALWVSFATALNFSIWQLN